MAPIFLFLALSVAPGQRKEAERLAHRSVLEYNVGDFPAALADLKRAYLLDPKPGMLFDLAQCHRALSHWAEADFFFRGYLRESPNGPHRDQARKLLVEVQGKLAPAAPAAAAPPVLVPLPAVPPEPPGAAAAPAVAIEAPQAPPAHHSHGLAIGLGVAGLVAGGAATYFGVELSSFESLRGGLEKLPAGAATAPQYSWTQLQSDQSAARINQWLTLGLGILGLAGLTAAGFTW